MDDGSRSAKGVKKLDFGGIIVNYGVILPAFARKFAIIWENLCIPKRSAARQINLTLTMRTPPARYHGQEFSRRDRIRPCFYFK
jgi:hypothetical protein